MSRKDYIEFAKIAGDGLAVAQLAGGEVARTEFYNECYTPLVSYLKSDNPAFDMLRFSHAAATAEDAYLAAAKDCGRVTS